MVVGLSDDGRVAATTSAAELGRKTVQVHYIIDIWANIVGTCTAHCDSLLADSRSSSSVLTKTVAMKTKRYREREIDTDRLYCICHAIWWTLLYRDERHPFIHGLGQWWMRWPRTCKWAKYSCWGNNVQVTHWPRFMPLITSWKKWKRKFIYYLQFV